MANFENLDSQHVSVFDVQANSSSIGSGIEIAGLNTNIGDGEISDFRKIEMERAANEAIDTAGNLVKNATNSYKSLRIDALKDETLYLALRSSDQITRAMAASIIGAPMKSDGLNELIAALSNNPDATTANSFIINAIGKYKKDAEPAIPALASAANMHSPRFKT